MKLQKWLLPSKANKYHPLLLRPIGLGIVVALLLSINVSQNLTEAHKLQVLGVATSISASEVISLSNQERANNGLSALSYNSQLTSAAQAKARDMFAKDYWAHYAPDGTSPWYFITNAGYTYTTAGENLAKGFETSDGVVQGWMNSPGHRANILNTSYRDTGIAVMDGTLQGEQTTLVVAMYGAPKAVATAPAPTHIAPKSSGTTKKAVTAAPVASQPAPTPAPAAAPAPTPTSPASEPKTQTQPVVTPTTSPTRSIDERSVSARESRSWAQNATLLLVCTLFLVSVFKHTVVWRTEKRGWRHIWLRAHPAAQYGLLFVAIVANLTAGAGVIR